MHIRYVLRGSWDIVYAMLEPILHEDDVHWVTPYMPSALGNLDFLPLPFSDLSFFGVCYRFVLQHL